jgi:alcohol dehydrogenase class IV
MGNIMKTMNFVYQALPSRVIFGAGTLSQLPVEIDRSGAQRALILSTPEQKELAEKLGVDCVIAIGGGMNAIALAAEGLYAVEMNPIMRLQAIEGIAALSPALPKIVVNARDSQARSDARYGA